MESDFAQFRTAFAFQLRSYLRTSRFLALVLFVAAVALAVAGIEAYRGSDFVHATSANASDFFGSFLQFLHYVVVVAAALLGGDALAVDLAGGPGYLMLTQPVRRRVLFLGRFVAAALAVFAATLVYYAIGAATVFAFFGTVPLDTLLSIAAAGLFGLAALAIAFFFSSFFRTPAVGIVAAFLILLLAFPVLTLVGTFGGFEPWFSLDWGATVVTVILSSGFVHEQIVHVRPRDGVAITLYTFQPYFWEGLAIMAGYFAVFFGLTTAVYASREVKG
jgi:ABC-2 type transport system permease protein